MAKYRGFLMRLAGALSVVLLGLAAARADAQGTAGLTQVVEQAAAPVTWAMPASIGYGTALDGAELNASSTLTGTFVYAPAAGAVPAAGQQTLSVVFTPQNVNYRATTVQVPLMVRSAAGATFRIDLDRPGLGKTVWTPGESLTAYVSATGDFHQPVSFTCSVTGDFECLLDHSVLRPVGGALPLRIKIRRVAEKPAGVPGAFVPALALVGLLLRRRKRLQGLLGMVLLAGMIGIAGCGTARTGVATVTARSLLETKTLVVNLTE